MLAGLPLLALLTLPNAQGAELGVRAGLDFAASPAFGHAPDPVAGAGRSAAVEGILRGPFGISLGVGLRAWQMPSPLQGDAGARLRAGEAASLSGLRPLLIGALIPGDGAVALKLGVGPDFSHSVTGVGVEGRLAWSAPIADGSLRIGPEGSIQTRFVTGEPGEFLLFPCLALRLDWGTRRP
jgi:hypothetical protein